MPYADPSRRAVLRPSRSKHTHLDDGDPFRMYCGVLRKHRGAPRASTRNPLDATCPRCQQRWGWSCAKAREQPKIGVAPCVYCVAGFNNHNTDLVNLHCRYCGRSVYP